MDMTILIPSYEPDEKIVGFVDELASRGFGRILVVDDGSGASFGGIFAKLRAKPFCTVLSHEVNRGKGAALKTGLEHVFGHWRDSAGVLTVDADGQHAVEDCVRMAETFAVDGEAVCLGSRDFSIGSVPFRSWIGNRWSSLTFALVLGRWLPDTQTGLRAFPVRIIPRLLSVQGDRYEYEMGVLMMLARSGARMKTLPISTIYENGNSCSHFRPVRDTLRINRLVLADFVRFTGVSIVSFVLDQGLAWAFASALRTMDVASTGVIWTSGFAARIMSSAFNFTLNRSFVFRSNCGILSAAWKYTLLCVVVIVLSNLGVTGLSFAGVPRGVAKFTCDVLLCFAGYGIQSKFVFGR